MRKIFTPIIVPVALIACDRVAPQDTTTDETSYEEVRIEATLPQTKVSISGVTPLWTEGDCISMFTSDGTQCTLTAETGGSATTVFSGQKPSGTTLTTAIYPHSDAYQQKSSSTWSVTLPASQNGSSTAAMMLGVGSEKDGYTFSNIDCVLKLNVPSSLAISKIELTRDSQVSGSHDVTLEGNGTVSVTNSSSISSADKGVTVSSSAALSGDIYLAVLPSSGKDYTLVFTNTSGQVAIKNGSFANALSAGTLKTLGTVSGLSFGPVAIVSETTPTQTTGTLVRKTEPQIPNGDFETWTYDGTNLPNNWNSFQTADGTYNTTFYSNSNRQVERSNTTRPESAGNYSVRIWARSILGSKSVGNITTGRVHRSSTSMNNKNNYNYTDRDGSNTSGSVTNPCYMTFTGYPDSIVVWAKFKPAATLSDYPYAKFSAVIHDDHDYVSYGDADNDNDTNKGYVVASASKEISTNDAQWQRISLPFVYTTNTSASYIQLNAYTNSNPGKGTANDELYLDDIEVIYNSTTVTPDSNGWASMCLDYNALVPSDATAYYATEMLCGYVRLVEIPSGSVIPKSTGVIVKASGSVVFEGSTNTPVTVSGNILQGTLSDIAAPSGCYVLSPASTSSLAAFGSYSGSTLAAGSVYIP